MVAVPKTPVDLVDCVVFLTKAIHRNHGTDAFLSAVKLVMPDIETLRVRHPF